MHLRLTLELYIDQENIFFKYLSNQITTPIELFALTNIYIQAQITALMILNCDF